MTPTEYAPDPWPVDGPAELSDSELADALRDIDSPYISNILGKLANIHTADVVVWLLFLGRSYDAEHGTVQGYYIRAVVRSVRALRANLDALAPGATSPFARNVAGQLRLSLQMIPLAPNEERLKVVGWGFAELE